MLPDNEREDVARQAAGQKEYWFKPVRCSVCSHFSWFYSIVLKEPDGAPEPRREWVLCKSCFRVLVVEMFRSTVSSPARLRIAMGLVAAERSPAYLTPLGEKQQFQREFTWFTWSLVLFALLHLVIFAVVWAVPH